MNVKVGDNVIRSVFDKDVVSVYHGILFDLVHFWIRFILNKLSPCTWQGVFYVCVSNEELGHCVVKEGFEKFRTGYKKERIKEKEHL